jgi:hypothetical protein
VLGETVAASITWVRALGNQDIVNLCVNSAGNVRVATGNDSCKRGETKLALQTAAGSDQAYLPLHGKADDADKLDGIDSQDLILQCASGQTQSEDVCFTDEYSATTWDYDYLGCVNRAMRLPSIAEQSFIYLNLYSGTPTAEGWVDESADGSTAFSLTLDNAFVNSVAHSIVDSLPYRCVSSPTNQGAAATSVQSIASPQQEPALKPR